MTGTEAVQRALVGAMRADAALVSLVADRVFDDVPVSAAHPYISLGPEDWRVLDLDCTAAEDGVVQIDVWSRAPGRVECRQITDRVAALFQDAALSLTAPFGLVVLRVLQKRVLVEDLQRHGVVILDVKIQEVPA